MEQQSSRNNLLLSVPTEFLTNFILPRLPVRPLACIVATSCRWLRERADEQLLQRAASLHLGPQRPTESIGCLYFAVAMREELLVGWRVAIGFSHTAVISDEGNLKTFGHGPRGQLGHGSDFRETVPRALLKLSDKRVVLVTAGMCHTAVVTSNGELYTFGCGDSGMLGHGSEVDETTPRIVEKLIGRRIIHAAAGDHHTAVLTSNNQLYTFGAGWKGQLGHSGHEKEVVPRVVSGLEGNKLVQVAAGYSHTAIVTSEGLLYMCGAACFGPLGHEGDSENSTPRVVEGLAGCRVVHVAAGGEHTAVVTQAGQLLTFGRGDHGQLGLGGDSDEAMPTIVPLPAGTRAVQAATGGRHTAVMTDDGQLFTWGAGSCGQLGHGAAGREVKPRLVQELVGKRVVEVAACSASTAVVTSELDLRIFGG